MPPVVPFSGKITGGPLTRQQPVAPKALPIHPHKRAITPAELVKQIYGETKREVAAQEVRSKSGNTEDKEPYTVQGEGEAAQRTAVDRE